MPPDNKEEYHVENKTFLAVIGIIIAVVSGVIILSNTAQSPGSQNNSQALQVKEHDHIKGAQPTAETDSATENEEEAASSDVVLVEYGDFQCPACGAMFPLVNQAVDEYGDDLTFVFRHYPLTQIHPNAMVAHRAAEAAAQQDKFFDMHDQLYANQQQWSEAEEPFTVISGYAEAIGLDMQQFEQDYNDPATLSRVNDDLRAGGEVGVSGTPTFFLNGEKVEFRSYEAMQQAIEEAINEAESAE